MKKISIAGVSFLSMIALTTVLFFNSCESDACKDIVCVNGNCVDGTCVCDDGYEGTLCDEEERTKFVATYTVSGTVTCPVSGNGSFTNAVLAISNSASGVTKVVINFASALTLTGTVDGTSFTIESQTVSGFTYTGSGSLSGSNITVIINEFDPGLNETCIYNLTGPKQ